MKTLTLLMLFMALASTGCTPKGDSVADNYGRDFFHPHISHFKKKSDEPALPVYESEGKTLHIEKSIFTPDLLKISIAQRVLQVESMYTETPSPYQGQVTLKVTCPPEFLPKKTTTLQSQNLVMELFANERFTFGVCLPDQKAFHVLYGIFYCEKQRALWEIKLFVPIKQTAPNPNEFLNLFECKK